jgi:hypothetical protein
MREVGIVGRYRFNPTTDEDAISGRLLDVVADLQVGWPSPKRRR